MVNKYMEEAAAIKGDLVKWRRHIHQNPELGLKLPMTSAFICSELDKMGISYTASEENSHVVALLGQGDKCIMLRSDMDALPIQEESGEEFASTNGCMHACGHDMHAAVLLGAAKLLKAHEAGLKGKVKLLFQSGEEVFKGAETAIAEGVLENPRVDAAVSAHMASAFPVGGIGYGYFPMSAVYGFRIDIEGKGTHGSTPEKGVSPINAAVHIYLALQELIAREISASTEAVITIGRFESGSASNIIPSSAVLEGTLRTFDSSIREYLIGRISEVAKNVGEAYRAEVKVTAVSDCPATVNDKELTDEVVEICKGINPEFQVLNIYHVMGSEDFAFFTDKLPCCYLGIGALYGNDYPVYSEHNPKVRFNEDALVVGAATYAGIATEWLETHA
ncbi:MAG: amidohydrolase [Mogibacterium sp.]|nr:amidohydrolase [Mogibacterium sp.]